MRPIELLETRRLLTSFTASSVTELIADINAANAAGGANTIALAPGTSFKLSAADNQTHGPTGLPVIAAGNDLTVVGAGNTIERGTAKGTPTFRLFDVAPGASLALRDLTLSGGVSLDSYGAGGGIYSLGTVSLNRVTVQNCVAQATSVNGAGYGGGVFSGGASAVLAVTDSTFRGNQAIGNNGYQITSSFQATGGGSAFGGGVYAYGSSATFTNVTVDSNVARAGNGANGYSVKVFGQPVGVAGGPGGNAYGGGIYAVATTAVELRGTTVTRNTATGGIGGTSPRGLHKGADGTGQGGGVYIPTPTSVGLDAFTQSHTNSNTASTSANDIFGSFTILA
jgi:hypothetical protein